MFVPLHDENVLKSIRFQYVTIGLIAVNVIVFLFEALGLPESTIASFAIVRPSWFPRRVSSVSDEMPYQTVAVPERLTLLSYMFFHGDHLPLGR